MPQNGFNVGRDVGLTIVTGSGPLTLNLITGFQSKQETTETNIKGIDGATRFVRFINGWTGGFTLERQDATLDRYFAQIEANFYAGINETPVTLTETITEVDGSVSQFRYLGVLLKYDDAGEYRGDATVKQTMSFVATMRKQIA